MLQNITDDLRRFSNTVISDFQPIRAKAGVHVYRCLYGGTPAVVKYFEHKSDRREIFNYQILQRHNIPTIKTLAFGEATLVLEDITASADWRLAVAEDLADEAVVESLARWYFTFHENGANVPELNDLFFEFGTLTPDNLRRLSDKFTESRELLDYVLYRYDAFAELLRTPAFTLTYNDFYYTNLVVRKDKTAAMMFDYNLLGKGYRFSDFSNVCYPLSNNARMAFLDTYNRLYREKHGKNRTEHERLEKRINDLAGPLYTLFVAFTQHENEPDWADDAKQSVRNGSLLHIAKSLLQPSAPYAVTFMYGENGTGNDVELRFNWLTDREAQTRITCEERETFEANGFKFTQAARHACGTCTLIENNTPIVSDTLRPHINTASYYSHKAEITLEAERYYYYSVGDEPNPSPPVLIKTREENPAAFSFLWFADPQQDKYARGTPFADWDGVISPLESGNFQENLESALTHAFAPEQKHLYINGTPDFALCTGDHSEHGYDKDGFDGFFQAAGKILATTPYAPAIGNHDLMGAPNHTGTWDSPDPYAAFFKSRFNPPKNGAAHTGKDGQPAATQKAAKTLDGVNYFFTYGNALFMVLQGNPWHTAEYALDEQIEWMRHVVATHGQNRWKIILMHHGVYTVSYNSVHGYEKLMPFYDEYGIDLVLSGHNHVYARSKPIRNYQPAKKGQGTVHITGGTVSGNCAWGGYIYKPDRQIPEKNGLPMKEAMDFLSLTDLVDDQNKNIYQIITINDNGINITALRAHDNTVMKHNAPSPSDAVEELQTPLTASKPLSCG
ncbi:MAG: metallophosphoesterase [Defluviitaleaceae bacterium]|nr:metallophosphoesterase [Defluviitaleaceae bacterium]